MTKRQSQKANLKLTERMKNIDAEFEDLFKELAFTKEHDLQTFSPIDAVQNFELRGLQKVSEPTRDEMMDNNHGMRKLLANMLGQCKPGALSQDDLEQLSGINGREVHA